MDKSLNVDRLSIAAADRYKAGKLMEAEDLFRSALKLEPRNYHLYYNLGLVIQSQHRLTEAVLLYQQAIDLQPDYVSAYINLGIVLKDIKRVKESIVVLERAIELAPARANAHYNLALALLVNGQLDRGFQEYEYRFQIHDNLSIRKPDLKDVRLWQGENIDGKNLLICHEQGIGDAIQFIRYIEKLQTYGANLTVATHPALQKLFVTCLDSIDCRFVNIEEIDSRQCDRHIGLLSLPYILKTTATTIPDRIPYIRSPKERIEISELDRSEGLRIGLVWATDRQNKLMYRHKSIRVEGIFKHLKAFLGDRSISVYSLQVGDAAAWIQPYLDLPNVYSLSDRLRDFSDTAAIIDRLDLVITVDTAVAHLAGAMGKPVWIMLPFAADWRWGLDRNDSPWYPTMRLFRQPQATDWGAVLNNIEIALVDLIHKP
jgi:TPR repeat/Glycosyltransferase family 9 (heptosyltransferase)